MQTDLTPRQRIVGEERDALAKVCVRRYTGGESVRDLAASLGRSYGFMHRLLEGEGVVFRRRGAAEVPRAPKKTRGAVVAEPPKPGAGIVDQPLIPPQGAYQQVADRLRSRILAGALPPGSALPGEVELAQGFAVGRDTIRRAFGVLRGEGLITTVRGDYSRVRAQPARVRLLLGPADQAIARMPLRAERERYGLVEGTPVIVVRRADGATEFYPADCIELCGDGAGVPSK